MMTRAVSLVIVAASLAVAGCSSRPNVRTYPVTGQVLRKGKPVAEALVVFHPSQDLDPSVHKPIGFTDEEGRFKLTTWSPADGAPVGAYRVTVEQRARRMVGEEMVRDGPNQLPRKLATPDTTPIQYVVHEGVNEVPTITIE